MPPTVVLDTNAWLDLLVFDDPALRGVDDGVRDDALRIAIDARARAELARVLGYAALHLDTTRQAAHLARADALATRIEIPAVALPRCTDPDDQLFLEIAVASNARWLLTRDDALLRMSRRMQRDHGLAILTPAAWRAGGQMSKR